MRNLIHRFKRFIFTSHVDVIIRNPHYPAQVFLSGIWFKKRKILFEHTKVDLNKYYQVDVDALMSKIDFPIHSLKVHYTEGFNEAREKLLREEWGSKFEGD